MKVLQDKQDGSLVLLTHATSSASGFTARFLCESLKIKLRFRSYQGFVAYLNKTYSDLGRL